MDRQKHTDGFTMVEMIIVLLLVCFCTLLFPFTQPQHKAALRMQLEGVRQELIQYQLRAIHEKRVIQLSFRGHTLRSEERSHDIGIDCEGALSFNPSGNVNRAMSIPCWANGESGVIVVLLGCGRMYVK